LQVAITHADPPTRPPPGFTGQARVVAHLDGGVETVTVDVDDFSLGHINAVFRVKKRRHAGQTASISLTPVYSTSSLNVLFQS
jgi:hypothetical protein